MHELIIRQFYGTRHSVHGIDNYDLLFGDIWFLWTLSERGIEIYGSIIKNHIMSSVLCEYCMYVGLIIVCMLAL